MYKKIIHTIVEEYFDTYPGLPPVVLPPEVVAIPAKPNRLKNIHRNLRPQAVDEEDYVYQPVGTPLQPKIDLRQWASPVEDQSNLGSCTANAVVNAYELLVNQLHPADSVDLSRLFVYYNTRQAEGTIKEDSGAYVRDALKAVKALGICTEKLWPYDIEKFTVEPAAECYRDAEQRKITRYQKINSLANVLDALNNNQPVPIGLTIFEPFLNLNSTNSIVVEPLANKENLNIGGHALCLVGYDIGKELLLAKNSFGTDWGDAGYCWIPFHYMRKYGYDMWVFDLG